MGVDLMKNGFFKTAVWITALIFAVFAAVVGFIILKGYGISVGRYLEAQDGTPMFVCESTPIRISDVKDRLDLDKLNIGDKILVLHDGIAESYPAQTGAYAVIRLSRGTEADIPQSVTDQLSQLGWLDSLAQSAEIWLKDDLDTTVSYGNWADTPSVSISPLNLSKLQISSVRHLPVYKFDTLDELVRFKQTCEGFDFDSSYNEVPSFNDATSKYDSAFFENNTLILVYLTATSGSYRYDLHSVYCDGDDLVVHVQKTNDPEDCTCDMAGWFITVALPDSVVKNCTEFDADLNNF